MSDNSDKMTVAPGEIPQNETGKSIESLFQATQAANVRLLAMTGRYYDRLTPKRMRELNHPNDEVASAFTEYLTAVLRDETLVEEEKASALTVLLMELTDQHSQLVADYLDDYTVADVDSFNESFTMMKQELLDALHEGKSECVDKAMEFFSAATTIDWKLTSQMYEGSWKQRFDIASAKAKPVAYDMAKVVIGSTIGAVIATRLRKQ